MLMRAAIISRAAVFIRLFVDLSNRYIQANWATFQGNVTFIGGGVPW